MEKEFIKTEEAAAMIGMRKEVLNMWRLKGVGPRHFKFNKSVRYKLKDIEDFIAASERQSTAE